MTKQDPTQIKSELFDLMKSRIEDKKMQVKSDLQDLFESKKAEEKSSAGDKYETSRELISKEEEMLGERLKELDRQQNQLEILIQNKHEDNCIKKGSLICVSGKWIFCGIAIGEFNILDLPVMTISEQSPLFQLIKNKKADEEVMLNGKKMKIEFVC